MKFSIGLTKTAAKPNNASMPAASAKATAPLYLICGEDDYGVQQRSREIYQKWVTELGGSDHEVIEGAAASGSEAMKVLGRLREALQTLPFFGGGKVIWLRGCNFLGDERSATNLVNETLGELAQEFKTFSWNEPAEIRLLISSGKVDKRKVFYKAIDKIGKVENFAGWSVDDKDWDVQAEGFTQKALQERGKEMTDEALSEFVARIGPAPRQLQSEVEKLALYVNARKKIDLEDVNSVTSRNKSARAFALGDALGDRNLPVLLKRLDETLWEVRLDSKKSEIGVLYGIISKVRSLLLLKILMREGWIKPVTDFGRFKAQLQSIPVEKLPEDKRFNPLSVNPYILFKALSQARNYTEPELVRAMELLFEANFKLVSRGLDESLVLQQALVQIVSRADGPWVDSKAAKA